MPTIKQKKKIVKNLSRDYSLFLFIRDQTKFESVG